MKKNSIIAIAGIFIGFLVLILIILWVVSLFSHKYFTYEEVEAKMVEATDTFYKKNPQILPVNDGRTTLSYNTLVENDCIKPLNELLKDGDSCSAEVYVIKNDSNFNYIPRLTCSDKYSTIELSNYVLKNHEVVSEGSGLYSDGDGGYYFKGKIDDNYVVLGNNHDPYYEEEEQRIIWQIISIDKNNRIKMISTYPVKDSMFDNRYNENEKMSIGYNDFEMSVMKDTLKALESEEKYFTNTEKSVLSKSKLCIGKRNEKDESKDGNVECSVLSEDEYLFGLITPYEYMRASLDENCKTMVSRSCQNYNLLSKGNYSASWTLTAVPDNNYQVYSFDGRIFYKYDANDTKSLYITAYLDPYVIFKSGDGTKENPYKLFK